MPRQLAKQSDGQASLSPDPFLISLPYDFEKWGRLVHAMTAHFLDRYGFEEIRDWIFTFWNEAQSGLHFDFNNDEAFFELYHITWQAVKEVDSRLHMASSCFATKGKGKRNACSQVNEKQVERYTIRIFKL